MTSIEPYKTYNEPPITNSNQYIGYVTEHVIIPKSEILTDSFKDVALETPVAYHD